MFEKGGTKRGADILNDQGEGNFISSILGVKKEGVGREGRSVKLYSQGQSVNRGHYER